MPMPQPSQRWLRAIERMCLELRGKDAPKHELISEAIRAVLRSNDGSLGNRLPPERAIARAVGSSLGTVQKALANLAAEGAISRELGRGTFARLHWTGFSGPWHFRFVERLGGAPEGVNCDSVSVTATRSEGAHTDVLDDDPLGFVRIYRRLSGPRGLTLVTRTWLSASRFGSLLELTPEDIRNENLRVTLRERFGVPIVSATQTVCAATLPAFACSAMKLEVGTIGLTLEVVGYERPGSPVFYADIYCPPNVRKMTQPLVASDWV